jgi:hypothetical protein
MPDASNNQLPLDGTRPAAALVDTTARWLSQDDDIALGCECANPALQIERWGQESLPFTSAPA